MQKPGYFITIEGVEGAGKSTVLRGIVAGLEKQKIDFIVTREFGGTEIAEKIRHILLGHHQEKMCVDTEILLAFAARAQHLKNLILPALREGKWVLCDRFTDATYAYQGAGRGEAQERIATIENWVQGELRPDLTLLLDLDAQIGLERIKKTRSLDRIEVETLDFFKRVRQGYLEIAKREPWRYRILDANKPVIETISEAVNLLLSFHK